MKNVPIKGIIPPIVTPMSADESVNIPELRNQIERQIAGGVHGIFPFGTNGEGYILSMKEKEEVLEATIDQVKGRVPVYAGTGCISTRDTIYMSKRAEELGADVLSIITPSFALASQKELYDHYVEVAEHVNIPIVLYNIPPRTGNKLRRRPWESGKGRGCDLGRQGLQRRHRQPQGLHQGDPRHWQGLRRPGRQRRLHPHLLERGRCRRHRRPGQPLSQGPGLHLQLLYGG